jgi:hypothetical protein
MAKLDKMIRFIPGLYNPDLNPNTRGLLYAWAEEDDNIVQQIQNAKEQIFIKTARLQYLDALGSNVGVFRPTEFNLADASFRNLIPALSFYPKQVVPTIIAILNVFYGENNPRVSVNEINPNEVVIQIPSSVPALRRDLRGSLHLHAYNGSIVSVDNILKEMVVDFNEDKVLQTDELAFATIGQGLNETVVLSNSAGTTGVVLQFPASADLSAYNIGENINGVINSYPGAFMPDPTSTFTTTRNRGVLGQDVNIGQIIPTLTMSDASGIPNTPGQVVFSFGRNNQEGPIEYFGRPNNTTLLLSPTYIFQKEHLTGEAINVTVLPYQNPDINGTDYSIYLVGVTAARLLAQQIVNSVTAAGVVIRWIVSEPVC